MKELLKKIIARSLLLLLLLPAACSLADPEPSINYLLTGRSEEGKEWKLISYKKNGLSDTSPCESDDVYKFAQRSGKSYRGGALSIDPGFLKCYIDETTETYDWFYGGSDERYIYIEVFADGILQIFQYEIIEISDNKLILQNVIEHPYGDKADIIDLELKYAR